MSTEYGTKDNLYKIGDYGFVADKSMLDRDFVDRLTPVVNFMQHVAFNIYGFNHGKRFIQHLFEEGI